MKVQYLSKKLIATTIIAASLVSCSEDSMDEVNKDINHVTEVPAKLILTDVMTSTAFSVVGGDFNTYLGIYVEHQIGCDNQLYRAENRTGEPQMAATFNNVWGNLYTTLKDAKIAIAKCSEGGPQEGNYVTRGIAEILAAYNLAVLTDMYGDVPWTEACDYKVSMTPKIDKQELIYKDIMAYLEAAIADLQKGDKLGMGDQDLIYKGNAASWLKTAYGLKARYTMRTMLRTADRNAAMQTVLDCIAKSYTSASEQCSYNMYNTGVNINPLFGFFWAREGIAASKSLFDKLVERKDPRIGRMFMDPKSQTVISSATDPVLKLAKHADLEQGKSLYTTSLYVAAQTAPTHLLSYHELLFLKAEALIHLNKNAEALEVLKEAVIAGIANAEINTSAALASTYWNGFDVQTKAVTADEAKAYFDTNIVPLFNANPLKETMIQKYIAFSGANGESTECYNDVRRMKALKQDIYGLQNPKKFPLRCPYGNDDTTANPNVQQAYGDGQYVYTESVWWAGGTR